MSESKASPWWTTTDHERVEREQKMARMARVLAPSKPPDQWEHCPPPRPIPIIVGCRTEDIGRVCEDFQMVVRVVEPGFEDVAFTSLISHRGYEDKELFAHKVEHYLDRSVRELTLLVGRRHGTWICHITPLPMYGWVNPHDAVYVPPVAWAVRQLSAERVRGMYSPAIVWSEDLESYDPEQLVRMFNRPADEMALGVRSPQWGGGQ